MSRFLVVVRRVEIVQRDAVFELDFDQAIFFTTSHSWSDNMFNSSQSGMQVLRVVDYRDSPEIVSRRAGNSISPVIVMAMDGYSSKRTSLQF